MTTKAGSHVANKIERKRSVSCVIVQLFFRPWVKVLQSRTWEAQSTRTMQPWVWEVNSSRQLTRHSNIARCECVMVTCVTLRQQVAFTFKSQIVHRNLESEPVTTTTHGQFLTTLTIFDRKEISKQNKKKSLMVHRFVVKTVPFSRPNRPTNHAFKGSTYLYLYC